LKTQMSLASVTINFYLYTADEECLIYTPNTQKLGSVRIGYI